MSNADRAKMTTSNQLLKGVYSAYVSSRESLRYRLKYVLSLGAIHLLLLLLVLMRLSGFLMLILLILSRKFWALRHGMSFTRFKDNLSALIHHEFVLAGTGTTLMFSELVTLLCRATIHSLVFRIIDYAGPRPLKY